VNQRRKEISSALLKGGAEDGGGGITDLGEDGMEARVGRLLPGVMGQRIGACAEGLLVVKVSTGGIGALRGVEQIHGGTEAFHQWWSLLGIVEARCLQVCEERGITHGLVGVTCGVACHSFVTKWIPTPGLVDAEGVVGSTSQGVVPWRGLLSRWGIE